jgi:hypothetical protein
MSLFGDLPAPSKAIIETDQKNNEDRLKAQLEALKQGHIDGESEEEEEEEEEELDIHEEEAHAARTSDLRRRPRPRDEEDEGGEVKEGFPHARGSEAATAEDGSRLPHEAKRVRIHEDVVTATFERPTPSHKQQAQPEGGQVCVDEVSGALQRIASHIGNSAKFPKVEIMLLQSCQTASFGGGLGYGRLKFRRLRARPWWRTL